MGVKLEPYKGRKTRYNCPKCGRSDKFARYINDLGEYIADDVGRCNRENKCGYHKTPKEFYRDNPQIRYRFEMESKYKEPLLLETPIDYLPNDLVIQTFQCYEQNNFILFLFDLIGEEHARIQMKKYNVGTSRHWLGSTVFWQVDIAGRVRQLKIILFNSKTGKRVKSETPAMKWDYSSRQYREDVGGQDKSVIYGRFIQNGRFRNHNLQQCFFGEHLLKNGGRIAIVESEKTAILLSHFYPDLIWLATGGSNGAGFTKKTTCQVLSGRDIILFPDLGQYASWLQKAEQIKKMIPCKIIVSDLLENNATESDYALGLDIADYIINNNSNIVYNNDEIQLSSNNQRSNQLSKSNTSILDSWIPLDNFEEF